MEHDDSVYLGHILDTARGISLRVADVTREQYDADADLRDALAHRVQLIGEAASRVSAPLRLSHPDVPWNRIIGMRHRLVHDYMNVDYDVLWEVVTINMQQLIQSVAPLVEPSTRE